MSNLFELLCVAIICSMFVLVPSAFGYSVTSDGGDCDKFGTRSFATSTCTMNRDITNESIRILDDGITLDGSDFHIVGNHTDLGVLVSGVDDVIVENVNIFEAEQGIVVVDSSNVVLRNNEIYASENALSSLIFSE